MKSRPLAQILFTVSALVLALGCQPKRDHIWQTTAPTEPSSSKRDGNSSGGGSFGDESSITILQWAAEDLAQQILNSSPEIYKSLPEGWDQKRLAQIIRNVEPLASKDEKYLIPEVSRHGKRLMFDYRKKENGESYLTATRLFLDAYSHYEVNARPKQDFFYTIEEVKMKLAHEAAHLMGKGIAKETDMSEAREFAKSLLAALDSDNFECLPESPLPIEAYTPLQANWVINYPDAQKFLATRTRAYVFNRPSGTAATPHNMGISQQGGQLIPPSEDDPDASGHITVFAPKSYDASFSLKTIKASVFEGKREYGFKEGYFSWKLIDLRQAVLTSEGYKSNFKYFNERHENNLFWDYLDFKINESRADFLELETLPSLHQENWDFYRTQGQAKIQIQFKNQNVARAKIILLRPFNKWIDLDPSQEIRKEIPLKCIRSFKPI